MKSSTLSFLVLVNVSTFRICMRLYPVEIHQKHGDNTEARDLCRLSFHGPMG